MKIYHFLTTSLLLILLSASASAQQKTFCNPINLDYGFTPIPNFTLEGRHRSTADPVIVTYKDYFFLFSTNQWGYWYSKDMGSWTFVSRKFLKPNHKVYDDLCAPAVWVSGDTMFVIGSTYTQGFPIWMSTNPFKDEWTEAIDSSRSGAWDPAYFLDDDGRLYLHHGSSNTYPLLAREIDRKTLQPIGQTVETISLHSEDHGWERFGEYQDNNFMPPFMEGAWMTKHNNRYYLQYGAPGTEFSGYADGVYYSDSPMGGFKYQVHNPFSMKAGGFINGSGHGSTYQDKWKNYWHISTMNIIVKNTFERRNGIFPAGFDQDGVMYAIADFGDYPQWLPDGPADHRKGTFTGWMLLNYQKPVRVSSTLGVWNANLAVDEDIKTYWSAKTGDKGEWIESDLGEISEIRAIQINYADQDADYLGKQNDLYHQYILYMSDDGKNWKVLVDKSRNKTDVPHDYIELEKPVKARFVKLENIHMAAGKFAISGLRVFGKGAGSAPEKVEGFTVIRQKDDRRNCWVKWRTTPGAYAYNVYYGVTPDALYTSIMVYGKNERYVKTLAKGTAYFFAIEAINENGVGPRSPVMTVE
ncbi:MAG: discoidin domain-containing protein [Bacteroidetes bacterium]|nr:discoidin domain-containing protein [Bacteroidota bacterium]